MNIDLKIKNIENTSNISHSLTLNVRKILNCNISITATISP